MRTPPLRMLCTIARPDATATDSFGQPSAAPTLATRVPCHWWTGENAWTVRTDSGQTAVDQEHLLLARGQDIQQGDHVTSLTDEWGNVIFTDYRVVHHVGVMRSHLDCTLRIGKGIGGRS